MSYPEGYVKYKPTKEELESARAHRLWRREQATYDKEERRWNKENKLNIKRELAVLLFMKKNDVGYYHHGRMDSMLSEINDHIKRLKEPDAKWQVYDPYIWNHQGEGNNTTSRCLLGNLWSGGGEFETIYDVPLDGTYKFAITDSGSRGLGSYNYIKAVKADEETYVPTVNPGAFRPFGF
jgi:hypothetical protein